MIAISTWKRFTASTGLVVLVLVSFGARGQEANPPTKAPLRGDYVLRATSRLHDNINYSEFCATFTANLNEFRDIDFQTCSPRLSPKYPRFSLPQWEEIPLDLDIVRKILTGRPSIGYDRWLQITESARAKGEVKLWRLRIDLLKDGHLDTLVRLDHGSDGTKPYCSYYDSRQMITDIPDLQAARLYAHAHFDNTYRLGGDLVYDAVTERYYLLDWNRYGRSIADGMELRGGDIGATASVMVNGATQFGVEPVCAIEWVPTGRRRK